MCVLVRRISGFSVVIRPRFRRYIMVYVGSEVVLDLIFILVFLPYALCAGFGRIPPRVCNARAHVRNVLPPASGVGAIFFRTFTSRFRGHASPVLFVFLLFPGTRVPYR